MARPRGGSLTKEASKVFAVRLPKDLATAVDAAAGGHEHYAEWARRHFAQVVGRNPQGQGAAQLAGFEEGRKQGWAHANQVFREALNIALGKLKE